MNANEDEKLEFYKEVHNDKMCEARVLGMEAELYEER